MHNSTNKTQAILEVLLLDITHMYHPPTTLEPLQVDTDKIGSDSDHNIVIFAPKNNQKYEVERAKKSVKVRPLPESQILKFESEIINTCWDSVTQCDDINEKVSNFHNILITALDKYFPEKTVKISSLDKKWMSPRLKVLHRSLQREYFRNRRSQKWKSLKIRFKREKKKAIRQFYDNFVSELKTTNPGSWFKMAKRIGATENNSGDIMIDLLRQYDNKQSAQLIAEHFAHISSEYTPVNCAQLPCFLPAQSPPQVEEHIAYERIRRLRKTRSTLPIDLPNKLRVSCAVELAEPVTNIINTCLQKSQYPQIWKQEWVTPVPEITNPKEIKDLRKIACTSDFSKLFEGFLKDWILEDIGEKLDIGQYGGKKGIGTEHMIVCLLDRILKLLDKHPDRSAVVATCLDWAAAFDRQDPTIAVKKFIELGVRPSLIPLLISYLSNRSMKVKFNGEESDLVDLVGGGPQGTLLGQLE